MPKQKKREIEISCIVLDRFFRLYSLKKYVFMVNLFFSAASCEGPRQNV